VIGFLRSRSCFARLGCVAPVLAAALFATRADALTITGLSIAKGGTNTADATMNTGQNFLQTTSAVSTTLAPAAALDTLGSFSEFITRYAMMVAADRQNTSGNTTASMTSSYSITFTVDNPTGATVQIDIDTLRAGSLTIVSDSTGNSAITLGAITGQVNAVADAGLGLAAASLTNAASADAPFNQVGSGTTIVTSALTSNYVLQFDFTSTAASTWDEGAIRMGMTGNVNSSTADDYPGVASRTQANDGHFVDVKATIIAVVPEPGPGSLVALGLVALALRAHSQNRPRSRRS
jgi:hypothetical protein